MRNTFSIHHVTALILTLSVTSTGSWTHAEELKRYRDIESFEADLKGLATKEKKLDLNSDGQQDVLIFYSDPEKKYVGILIREKDNFVLLDPPEAEDYDVVGSPGQYELKIGHGTYPSIGDVHGSDQFYWYNFFKIVGQELEITNSDHAKFYKEMLPRYHQRIKELEQEILDLKQEAQAGKTDESIFLTLAQFRRDHIDRYEDFITKALEIIEQANRTLPNFSRPVLKIAIARADNDFTTSDDVSGRTVPIPKVVSDKIHEVTAKAYRWRIQWIRQHEKPPLWFPKLSEFYGPVFMISGTHNRQLYIFKFREEFDFTCYYLLFHDPKSNKITKQPPCINGKWSDLMNDEQAKSGLMKRPYVFFDDVNQDHEPELVIQEQVHNGTLYNAVIYHYFHIGKDLSLKHLLALETRLIDIFSERESGLIIRTIEKLKANQIRLLVHLESTTDPANHTPIGEVLLESPHAAAPFTIKSKTIQIEKYAGVLVTGAEVEDEDQFISNGYGFVY